MFGLTLLFMQVFFLLPLSMLGVFIGDTSLQTEFVIMHIYKDFVCWALAIYVSCMTAPSKRIAISVIYLVLVLVMMPRQLEIAQTMHYYGDAPWKMPFLVSVRLAGGILPLLIMIGIKYLSKAKGQAESRPPQTIDR